MSLFPSPALFKAIPPETPHGVIISIPEWDHNVTIAMGNVKSLSFDPLETTYPRFLIHPFVKQLANIILSAIKREPGISCLLFPSRKTAEVCCSFAHEQFSQSSSKAEIQYITEVSGTHLAHEVFALLFPQDQEEVIMKFWMFAGEGVSSRLAEQCLLRLSGDEQHESKLGLPHPDHVYSEYYRKHTPLSSVKEAKEAIRTRYSGIIQGGGNIRGVPGISIEDVYLYPTGMSAIWRCHQLLADTIGSRIGSNTLKYAHVDVLYIDSYRFLELTHPGYHYFTNDSIDDLERLLKEGTPDRPAILALFTDFPGNPHLRSPDLPRLRALADLYHFPIIIDETIGFHLNVQVLPYADVVVSSLTKTFSGLANVLGGTLMLNPTSPFYTEFKAHIAATYEDTYFGHDALLMEVNSREIGERIASFNRNAEALADMLYKRSVVAGAKDTVVQEVFYPKYQTPENYNRCRNTAAAEAGITEVGYSCLLSVSFTSVGAAKVFFNSLQCYKGPTLGTIVTLATPFVALCFSPGERMQWARDRGLEESLVRFSVGAEDTEEILNTISQAIAAAEQWTRSQAD